MFIFYWGSTLFGSLIISKGIIHVMHLKDHYKSVGCVVTWYNK